MHWISRFVRRQVLNVMRSGSFKSTASGIPIFVDPRSPDPESLASLVAESMRLIERYDRIRWNKCRRYLERVFVTPLGRPTAHYGEADHSCVLAEELVRAWDSLTIASVIVHEAVHARISRSAVHTSYLENASRIERLCLKGQLAFLERASASGHPGAGRLIDHYRGFLQQPTSSPDEELEREADRIMNLVAVDWVKRLAVRRLRKRWAKQQGRGR